MIKNILLVSAVFVLGACSVGPDYKGAPHVSFIDKWFAKAPASATAQQVRLDWWTVFKDPLLEKYIVMAVKNNNDIKVAQANVRRARALRREDSGSFFPQIGADASGDRSKSSDTLSATGKGEIRNLYDAGFDASWELDVFGGNRRSVEASDARLGSAIANYQDVMLSTLSEVARNYYEARGLQKRIAITEENSGLLRQSANLINDRLRVGEASEFDSSRAEGEYQLTRARLPNLQADLQSSIFSLSVLLGLPPESLLTEMQDVEPLPVPPDVVPVGLRSDMLRRRPDVRMAERELAASIADIGVSTAELFPQFFLTGDIGSQARVFGDVFSAAGGFWSLGSLVNWSIFEGGAIRARIDASEADADAAVSSYRQTVLEALADAESALVQYGQELETRKRLAAGVANRRKAVNISRELFQAGEEDYFAILDAERELIASEDDLVVSETNSIIKLIALYTALGGGWEVFQAQAGPPKPQ